MCLIDLVVRQADNDETVARRIDRGIRRPHVVLRCGQVGLGLLQFLQRRRLARI